MELGRNVREGCEKLHVEKSEWVNDERSNLTRPLSDSFETAVTISWHALLPELGDLLRDLGANTPWTCVTGHPGS